MRKKILRGCITLFWLLSMTFLINAHYRERPLSARASMSVSDELLGEKWMSIYREGEKVGYLSSRLERLGPEYKAGFKASESVFMRLKLLGEDKEIRTLIEAYLDGEMGLRSFSFLMESDMSITVSGAVEETSALNGKTLDVSIDLGGIKTAQRIPLRETPRLSAHAIPDISDMGVDKTVRFPIIDPATLIQDVMELRITGEERLSVMGKEREVFKLSGSFKGVEVALWATEQGEVLKEESAGFVFMRELKEEALKLGKPSVDISLGSAIPAAGKRPPSGGLSCLKVKLTGISHKDFELDGGFQSLEGEELTILRPEISGLGDSTARLKDREKYLDETPFIQTKDPEIASLSAEITKNAKDDLGRARLIYEWIYENINKSPAVTIPSAREVLESRRGDCNEHTALFIALSRAAGVPARAAVGLVYKDGFFYYHAWPEAHALGAWLPIDPTLGEFPADAGRIRLLTGDLDKQVRIISAVGRLKIEILEFKK